MQMIMHDAASPFITGFRFVVNPEIRRPTCATLKRHSSVGRKGSRMYSTFADYFGVIGQDVLGIGEAVLTLIGHVIGIGSTGPGTPGGAPPGQYPLA